MKIKEIRTRVVHWRGKIVPLPPHFCTNPMDLLQVQSSSMSTFTFHGWLVVEVIADNGLVISAIFYCVAGLALVEFTIRRLKVSWFMKALFYLMLFLTQIFGFVLVSLLGFIDSFADWRKIAAAKIALKS